MSGLHPLFRERRAGVLLHVSSLPGPYGVGDLGPSARRYVDWLQAAGQSFWQTLPVGPAGAGDSPYSARSSFAGEPVFTSLDDLVAEGWLRRAELDPPARLATGPASFAAARRWKTPRLRRAWERFAAKPGTHMAEFDAFRARHAAWLEPWCAREGSGDFRAFVQYLFDRQWSALRSYARDRGVRLLGDVPIFVPADSADVQSEPALFRVDRRGAPTVLTGCPPDLFNADGQVWGHPHYRWSAHRADSFAWWAARIAAHVERFDAVRLDHFCGFVRAWEVSASAPDPKRGRWGRAPGMELLDAFVARLGAPLPLFTEDMGPDERGVEALRMAYHLPCMRLLQLGLAAEGESPHQPDHVPADAVVYSGNHDCDTTAGWFRGLDGSARRRVLARVGGRASEVVESVARAALGSPAVIAMLPMQDVLGLGRRARMNVPGTPSGQWRWRLAADALDRGAARRLAGLTRTAGR